MEIALQSIEEAKKKYDFRLIKFKASQYLREVFQLQKDILKIGISETKNFIYTLDDSDQIIGSSGMITICNDIALRSKVRNLEHGEIFIIRCDSNWQLILEEYEQLQKESSEILFTCYIRKHPKEHKPIRVKDSIMYKFFASFLRFEKDKISGRFQMKEHVNRHFIV
jgi:hypothetical protein